MLQGTDEWRLARCGSIGASDAPRVVRRVKSGGYSADRETLMAEKRLERLTGVPHEIPKTFAMMRGTEREPEARLTYSLIRGVEVEEVGIVLHPTIKGAHASPDGLVGAHGLVEIKAPMPAAHFATLDDEQIAPDHIVQMMWQLACTGRQWCDYCSFNPDFPPAMQLWVRRVQRDARMIGELERDISAFIRELEQRLDRLARRYGVAMHAQAGPSMAGLGTARSS